MDAAAEFAPVAVFNNADGADAALLRKFGEPSWNNPVVRFLGADEKDLAPRFADDWRTEPLLTGMVEALHAAKRDVPAWLELAAEEARARRRERIVFAMS